MGVVNCRPRVSLREGFFGRGRGRDKAMDGAEWDEAVRAGVNLLVSVGMDLDVGGEGKVDFQLTDCGLKHAWLVPTWL